jgi:hypothetical protein
MLLCNYKSSYPQSQHFLQSATSTLQLFKEMLLSHRLTVYHFFIYIAFFKQSAIFKKVAPQHHICTPAIDYGIEHLKKLQNRYCGPLKFDFTALR